MNLSEFLYRAARLSRDVNAVKRGPKAIIKRQVRKAVYRQVNGTLNRILK